MAKTYRIGVLNDSKLWPQRHGLVHPSTVQPVESPYLLQVNRMVVMASDHFYLFTAWASFSTEAQKRLQAVQTPQEIVDLAAQRGYEISVEQLRLFARRLQEPHWVWNQHDEQWNQDFFSGRILGQPLEWRLQD